MATTARRHAAAHRSVGEGGRSPVPGALPVPGFPDSSDAPEGREAHAQPGWRTLALLLVWALVLVGVIVLFAPPNHDPVGLQGLGP